MMRLASIILHYPFVPLLTVWAYDNGKVEKSASSALVGHPKKIGVFVDQMHSPEESQEALDRSLQPECGGICIPDGEDCTIIGGDHCCCSQNGCGYTCLPPDFLVCYGVCQPGPPRSPVSAPSPTPPAVAPSSPPVDNCGGICTPDGEVCDTYDDCCCSQNGCGEICLDEFTCFGICNAGLPESPVSAPTPAVAPSPNPIWEDCPNEILVMYDCFGGSVSAIEACADCVFVTFNPSCDERASDFCTNSPSCPCESCTPALLEYVNCDKRESCDIISCPAVPAAAPVSSPVPAPVSGPTPAVAPSLPPVECPDEVAAVGECFSNSETAAAACIECVFVDQTPDCSTLESEICTGSLSCPCEPCVPTLLDYLNCRLADDCGVISCPAAPIAAPVSPPTTTPVSSPVTVGVPIPTPALMPSSPPVEPVKPSPSPSSACSPIMQHSLGHVLLGVSIVLTMTMQLIFE